MDVAEFGKKPLAIEQKGQQVTAITDETPFSDFWQFRQ